MSLLWLREALTVGGRRARREREEKEEREKAMSLSSLPSPHTHTHTHTRTAARPSSRRQLPHLDGVRVDNLAIEALRQLQRELGLAHARRPQHYEPRPLLGRHGGAQRAPGRTGQEAGEKRAPGLPRGSQGAHEERAQAQSTSDGRQPRLPSHTFIHIPTTHARAHSPGAALHSNKRKDPPPPPPPPRIRAAPDATGRRAPLILNSVYPVQRLTWRQAWE